MKKLKGIFNNLITFLNSKAEELNHKPKETNPIALIEEKINKGKKTIDGIHDQISRLEAQKISAIYDQQQAETEMGKYERIMQLASKQGNVDAGANALVAFKQVSRQYESSKNHADYIIETISQLEAQVATLETKQKQNMREFRVLKLQSEHAESLESINTSLRETFVGDDMSLEGIGELSRQIREKVAFEQHRNTHLLKNDENEFDVQVSKLEFQEYMQQQLDAPKEKERLTHE